MHEHNRFHGQQEILARFVGGCDPVFPPPLPGHLQHEWDESEACSRPAPFPAGFAHFVWSDRTRRRLAQRGQRRCVAIGAPWLYLMEFDRADGPVVPPPAGATPGDLSFDTTAVAGGTAWFPYHGLEGAHLAGMLSREIRALTPGPVTVVLTRPDAHVASLREAYERLGMSVTTLPPRVRPAGWWGPGQLEVLREVFFRHKRVASNRLDTALLLGGAAGLTPFVDGPIPTGRRTGTRTGEAFEMLAGGQRLNSAMEYCLAELGEDSMLPAPVLRMLLGWGIRD